MFSAVLWKLASGFENEAGWMVYGRLFFGRWEGGNSVCLKSCVPVSVSWLFSLIIWSWNNLILKQNIWTESNQQDICWWCSPEGMCKLRPQPHSACLLRYWVLSLTLNPVFFFQILKPLFGKSQLKQEILEQDYTIVIGESSLNPDCIFSLLFVEKDLFPIYLYGSWKKSSFLSVRRKGENFIQRGGCWTNMEFLCFLLPFLPTPAGGPFCSSTSSYVRARFSCLSTSSASLASLGRAHGIPWYSPV